MTALLARLTSQLRAGCGWSDGPCGLARVWSLTEHLFIVNAGPGTTQCIECQTGKVRWTERLQGEESWGSVVMATGRLYVTRRRGVTTVFRPNPGKLEVLAMNDLGEPSNATPAISDGQILLQTNGHL